MGVGTLVIGDGVGVGVGRPAHTQSESVRQEALRQRPDVRSHTKPEPQLAFDPQVPLQVFGVPLGVGDGVGVGVGVGEGVGVGVGVGVGEAVIVKAASQKILATALAAGASTQIPEASGKGAVFTPPVYSQTWPVGHKVPARPPQISPAAGAGIGALGAIGSERRWYNKMAVTTDTTASITVKIMSNLGDILDCGPPKEIPPRDLITLMFESAINY